MKKAVSIVLVLFMLSSLACAFTGTASAEVSPVWDGSIADGFDGGTGSADDPYLISSGRTLAFLAQSVNSGTTYKGMYIKLTDSIDLNNIAWTPIGYYFGSTKDYIAFCGNFDGGGNYISNLKVAAYTGEKTLGTTGTGLFGMIIDGSVSNLGIESGEVTVTGKWGGGITAYISGVSCEVKISNCYNKANIIVAGASSQESICAGIAGFSGNQRVTVENCVNYGNITYTSGKTSSMLAGICGRAFGGSFTSCYNTGNIDSGTATGGGLCGTIGSAEFHITDCCSSGVVSGSGVNGYLFGKATYTGTNAHSFESLKAYTGTYGDSSAANKADGYAGDFADGTTSDLDDYVTVLNEVLNVPTAPAESFLVQTERGNRITGTVSDGSATIDGVFDDAYNLSYRLYNYGSGSNALTAGTWNDMRADIYIMCDIEYLYIFASVTDGDVTTKGSSYCTTAENDNPFENDNIEFRLSFDGGDNVFKIGIDAYNYRLYCMNSAVSLENVVHDVKMIYDESDNITGWNAELAIPINIGGYNLLLQESLGLTVQLNDIDTSMTLASYSSTPKTVLTSIPIAEIHGDPEVAVTGITISESILSLKSGDTVKLLASVHPGNSYNRSVKWSSSDTTVATVDKYGIVSAVASGTATITATTVEGSFTADCTVTVEALNVRGVSLSESSLELALGKTKMLYATITPEDADNTNVTWKSSDTNVATVSKIGLVTAKSAGHAVITVTTEDGSYTADCNVTVSGAALPVTGISLDYPEISLKIGEEKVLAVTLTPEGASDTSVVWSSSDTSVATVDADGKVIGVKAGTAVITVTANDGGFSADCSVTVENADGDAAADSANNGKKSGCGSSLKYQLVAVALTAMVAVATVTSRRSGKKKI